MALIKLRRKSFRVFAAFAVATILIATGPVASAATYYVSPSGSDAQDGRSPQAAWKTIAKVNSTALAAGDQVLFVRGGQWRESLLASSNGTLEKPILYAAYGAGDKPKFWGSDVLANADFQPVADGVWKIAAPTHVGSVLVNHRFLLGATDRAALDAKPNTWFCDEAAKTLFIHTAPDPRSDGRLYTVCVRVDPIHSNFKNYLIFRDLVADESADVRDGYGFRVQGSCGVRLENCEAYRAGRHHFGAIDSTEFVGVGLRAAYAMPNIPGGATFYVSFSDPRNSNQTHRWIDCSAEHLENPGNRNYQVFYCHGEGLGPITVENMQSHGGMLSLSTSQKAPVTIRGGLIEDASLEIFGDALHVDGLRLSGNAAIDQYGNDGLFENIVMDRIKPTGGGPTGYGSAIVLRNGAKRNTIRFSTIVLDPSADDNNTCLAFVGKDSQTRSYANVLLAKRAVAKNLWSGRFGRGDLAQSDYNYFSHGATFLDSENREFNLNEWKAMGSDKHSLTGDPLFMDRQRGDYSPAANSPLLRAARVDAKDRPAHDAGGQPRPAEACAIGAFEPAPKH